MQSYCGKLLLWQHVHTQPYFFEFFMHPLLSIVFFFISVSSSPHGWDCFCPAIIRINCIFHQICLCYVWTYICIFVIMFIFYISLYVIFLYSIFHLFHFWILFAQILSKWCIWPIYRYIIYYCIIVCLHILLHTCFVVSWYFQCFS